MSHDVIHERKYKLTSRLVMAIGALMAVSGFSGCNIISGVNDYITYNTPAEDFVSGWRDKVWANRAYNARRETFEAPEYEAHFRAGFIAGYRNISQGGQGCSPSLPPRTYWSWRYQSAEGQAKVGAWFSGYPHGARAAEEDGVGNYYQIQVANWVDENDPDRECVDCGPDDPWDPRMWTGEGIEEIPQGYEGEFVPEPEGGPEPTPALPPDSPPEGGFDATGTPGVPSLDAPATNGFETGASNRNSMPFNSPAGPQNRISSVPEAVNVPAPQIPPTAGPYTYSSAPDSTDAPEEVRQISWDRFPELSEEPASDSTRRSDLRMSEPAMPRQNQSTTSPRTGMMPTYPTRPMSNRPAFSSGPAVPNGMLRQGGSDSLMPSLKRPNEYPIPTSSAVTQAWPRPGLYR